MNERQRTSLAAYFFDRISQTGVLLGNTCPLGRRPFYAGLADTAAWRPVIVGPMVGSSSWRQRRQFVNDVQRADSQRYLPLQRAFVRNEIHTPQLYQNERGLASGWSVRCHAGGTFCDS